MSGNIYNSSKHETDDRVSSDLIGDEKQLILLI